MFTVYLPFKLPFPSIHNVFLALIFMDVVILVSLCYYYELLAIELNETFLFNINSCTGKYYT